MVSRFRKTRLVSLEVVMILLAIVVLSPFYFVIANSLKSYGELLGDAVSLPSVLVWENYVRAWKAIQFGSAFKNSLLITIFSNIGLVILASMAAYRLTRHATRFNQLVLAIFIAAMVVPFQAIMIPLVKVASWFNLIDSLLGVIISYFGLSVSFAIFLYQGFMRSIPLEIEESARMDGCTPYGVFWRIVFPLLKPMTVTIVLLNCFYMWNDFLMPSIMLQSKSLHTIQVSIYSLFGEYTSQWDLALAALVMSIAPLLLLFIVLQRQVIQGITSGAVKG